MDDHSIVELYWQRDPDAIAESSRKYGGYCTAIARRILHSNEDAEECVNDTWLRTWNAIPTSRPQLLAPFLGRITRNLAFNRWQATRAERRGGGELPLALEELEECLPGPADAGRAVEDAELEQAVNRFLRALPRQACDIFLRRYWYVEPVAAIAGRYGLSQSAVKSSLFRSRQKLKQFLQEEGMYL